MRKRGILASIVLLFVAAFLVGVAVQDNNAALSRMAQDDAVVIANNAINGDAETLESVKEYNEEAYEVAKAQADSQNGKNHFGWDVFEAASNSGGDISAYVESDFEWALRVDPIRAAAVITHYVNVVQPEDRILSDDVWHEPVGQQPNAAAKAFLADHEYWQSSVDKFLAATEGVSKEIVVLDGYTSSMYMIHDGLADGVPEVVVRNSTNTGGHAWAISFSNGTVIKFRLECGYQPVDVSYWTPPQGEPPVDDGNPEPIPETPETPELEPKDPDAGPQGQNPTNPDFGGGANDPDDTDKTPTKEPTSPESYSPPKAPTQEQSTQSQSTGSTIEDHNNGGSETVDGNDYNVVVGGQNDNSSINDAYGNHNTNTVEEPVANDGTNVGEIVAPE